MQNVEERAELRVLVRHRADAFAAAALVKALVKGAGGSASLASLVATATTELAQNIVSHAGADGEVLAWIERGDIVIQARNTREARVHTITRGGLGQGQAAVRRMMDRIAFDVTPDGCLIVTARVRIEPPGRSMCR